ncbi:hypothetical protein [African swine fever virus]
MLVIFLGILGLLASQVLGLPNQPDGQLRPTEEPPENELEYWCTYMESCQFCWDCQDGNCINKVDGSVIYKNEFVRPCSVSRWMNKCMYDLNKGIYHTMNCSQPQSWNPYKYFRKEWKKDEL